MIASVRGSVLSIRLDGVVVEVGGVGMLVHTTPRTLADLRRGAEAMLHTSLVVREDSLTLFGFAEADERDVFEVLQSVTGVGPRLALAVLAVHSPEELRVAVASEDLVALKRVPGIGQKGAQRMVLDLADKIGAPSGELPAPRAGRTAAAAPAAAKPAPSPVVEALVGFGFSAKQAEDAVAAVTSADGGSDGTGRAGAGDAAADLATTLRAALRHLGRH
ncbi:Holliday junction DNA helicase subunit RuvA [Quadrisphaera granulorum]|uniref:Holliday junction branch migration complex subunit RuvA n=1 Tax=Quadrisphaera granulorum TaxID=317664 RepID=A0A316A7F4_9ACTN|nr:Holliday junction branch migration protein RuvA [Quadrisphaera granulorum]PWJ53533.1 Holliday junction DNA helicase subunit RuvA [Quadrisphaera granulorum]SZE96875.1 Holliday junction DNA helicase subunit RuvA [Quadrisphaera granulorum]